MRLFLYAIFGIIPVTPPIFAQTISISHTATRRIASSAATALAPGSLGDVVVVSLFQPSGPLPAGDTLTFHLRGAAGVDLDMPVVGRQPATGNPITMTLLLPANSPVGQAQIAAISSSTGRVFTANFFVGESGFGLFSREKNGSGPALAQVSREAVTLVGLATPVRGGDWVTLWGTGLGNAPSASVAVNIAGQRVPAAFAGKAPGLMGVDQINFQAPANMPDDCYVPISVEIGGAARSVLSLPVANSANVCNHRLGLTAEQMSLLDRGELLLTVPASFTSKLLPDTNSGRYLRSESIGIPFMVSGQAVVQSFTGLYGVAASGCRLETASSTPTTVFVANNADRTVTGPGNFAASLPDGFYQTPTSRDLSPLDSVVPSIFVSGEWKLAVTAGLSDPFTTPLRVPPAIRWNRAGLSPASRTSDLTLRWNPEGYTDRDLMEGSVVVGTSAAVCTVPATAGAVTIPAELLSQLPATSSTRPAAAELELDPVPAKPVSFAVPRTGSIPGRGLTTFSYLEVVLIDLR